MAKAKTEGSRLAAAGYSATKTDKASPLPLRQGLRRRRVDTDTIFSNLRHDISTLRYPPGTALKELDLCAEFGVSRTPIRQALQRLELAGLVQPIVGHGTLVTGIDLKSMRHLLEYRLELSSLLEHFLDPTRFGKAIEELRIEERRNSALSAAFDAQQFASVSHNVRMIVADQITNPFLAQNWTDSYYLASRYWFLCLPNEGSKFTDLQSQEIKEIIRSFESGEPARVASVVHDTLQEWIDQIWQNVTNGKFAIALG
jgi:DNA-binding GntR family transcriptional regulator